MFRSRRHACSVVTYLEPDIEGELLIAGMRVWRYGDWNRELGTVFVSLRVHLEICVISSERRRPADLTIESEGLRLRNSNNSGRGPSGRLGNGIHMPATADLRRQLH